MNIEYALRRKKLIKKIGKNNSVILFSKETNTNNNFYYLTGRKEINAIFMLIQQNNDYEFILFCNEPTKQQAYKKFGTYKIFDVSQADSLLPSLLKNCHTVYYNFENNKEEDKKINSLVNKTKNVTTILHEMRIKKSKYEIDLIKKAAYITTKGFLRAMQKCKPGIYEYELEAELLYEFMRHGGRYESFKSIVGSGKNTCVLHYNNDNQNKKISNGDLVLIDAGAKYKQYCCDVSRTFPASGKFTQKQRAIYDAVLNTQLAVIEKIRPGISFCVLQQTAEQNITKYLVSLGILNGKVKDLLVKQAFKPFFMHKIGHWIGLDVHDVGNYQDNLDNWRILEPGIVLTIEPGIYNFKNIGIRIEDVVLVTQKNCDVLTKDIPKTASEIELVMKK